MAAIAARYPSLRIALRFARSQHADPAVLGPQVADLLLTASLRRPTRTADAARRRELNRPQAERDGPLARGSAAAELVRCAIERAARHPSA